MCRCPLEDLTHVVALPDWAFRVKCSNCDRISTAGEAYLKMHHRVLKNESLIARLARMLRGK